MSKLKKYFPCLSLSPFFLTVYLLLLLFLPPFFSLFFVFSYLSLSSPPHSSLPPSSSSLSSLLFLTRPSSLPLSCILSNPSKKPFTAQPKELSALQTSTDSIGWRAPASNEWQDKYASYTDVSQVNSFADTLISYATMWYQYASRGEEGKAFFLPLLGSCVIMRGMGSWYACYLFTLCVCLW